MIMIRDVAGIELQKIYAIDGKDPMPIADS